MRKKIQAIAYYNNIMWFAQHKGDPTPQGCVVMDKQPMAVCFDALIKGNNVFVTYSEDQAVLLEEHVKTHFTPVCAAGGVVKNPNSDRLMIFREGHWDIPKGMVEPGESTESAALREVMEETGIERLSLGSLLLTTHHIYDKYGGWHIKETYWYDMFTSSKQFPTPQTSENITQAVWVSPELYRQRLAQSFASLRMLKDF